MVVVVTARPEIASVVVTTPTDDDVDTPLNVDAGSTTSGVSVVASELPVVVSVATTTDTTSYTYTDVSTSSSTSTSETTTDGVTTRTDTVTTTETTNYETSYDYAAEATRLWDIYTAINS